MNCKSISASLLGTFEQCELKYHAIYDLGIREEKEEKHPAARVGSAVHSVLEKIIQDKKVPNIQKICEKELVEPDDIKKVKQFVKNAVNTGYLYNLENVVDVEYYFKLTNIVEGIPVKGFIDRLDIDGDKALVIDIKTNRKAYTQKELKNNWQAKIYTIAVRKRFPQVKEVDTIFWFVQPKERKIITIMPEQSEKDEKELVKIYNKICKINKPKPKKNSFCKWCLYKEECPLFKKKEDIFQSLIPSL